MATTPNQNDQSSTSVSTPSTRSGVTRFRLQAKNFFLTFPQTTTTKEQALHRISSLSPAPKAAIVAQEKHADGHLHLHVLLSFEEKLRISDTSRFDSICGKHGNYQAVRSMKRSIAYLYKEDPSPSTFGDPESITRPSTTSKATTFAQMIDAGSSLQECRTEDPGYFLLNKRKIEEYHSFVAMKRLALSKTRLTSPLIYAPLTALHEQTMDITDWLNGNLFHPRTFKQPQLFIHGPPNSLKSSLINKLSGYLSIYDIPLAEDFFDFYNDEDYDLVVIDEFKGQKTLTWLNRFLDGSILNIRKKGSQFVKMKNLPVILLSNFSPFDCYQKHDASFDGFLARLKIISLDSPIDLDNILINV